MSRPLTTAVYTALRDLPDVIDTGRPLPAGTVVHGRLPKDEMVEVLFNGRRTVVPRAWVRVRTARRDAQDLVCAEDEGG
mgnify:FL=1